MSKSNKVLSLETQFTIQRAGTAHYRVDSSLIRKFLHECSCTSQPLSPGIIIIAALHEGEGLEIQLTAPYRCLKCNRYSTFTIALPFLCNLPKVRRIKISEAVRLVLSILAIWMPLRALGDVEESKYVLNWAIFCPPANRLALLYLEGVIQSICVFSLLAEHWVTAQERTSSTRNRDWETEVMALFVRGSFLSKPTIIILLWLCLQAW